MKLSKDTIRRVIGIISLVIFIFLVFTVKPIREIAELIFLSFILAYALKPIHKALVKRRVNKVVASVSILAAFIAIFVLALFLVVPSVIRESNNIVELIEEIGNYVEKINIDTRFLEELNIMDNIMEKSGEVFEKFTGMVLERSMELMKSFKENIVKLVGVPIIAFFFLSDGHKISNKFLILFSYKRRRIIHNILRDMDRVLTKYVFSEIILCGVISASTYIILKVYDVEFPLILSLLNGILNIIPYFGPPVGGILIILVALMNENSLWMYIVFWIIVSQIFESNIVSPMIIGESVNMHPVLIIMLLIFGGELGGFIGMVLAIPLGVVIKVLYNDINHFLFAK